MHVPYMTVSCSDSHNSKAKCELCVCVVVCLKEEKVGSDICPLSPDWRLHAVL